MRRVDFNAALKLPSRWSDGICRECRRSLTTAAGTIAEGDRVLLHSEDPRKDPYLTKPLRRAARIETHNGAIEHNGIIGKSVRDFVTTSKGRELRIQLPSLADYVSMTPRRVTPIYPADANLIVSLLDIHAPTAQAPVTPGPRFEILEAGTGHGSLTLYLARAISASNQPLPGTGIFSTPTTKAGNVVSGMVNSDQEKEDIVEKTDIDPKLESWKTSRKAIIHSLDISAQNTAHASQIVRGFRRGLYAGNVDFHVGDVSEWISAELEKRAQSTEGQQSKPFLAHVLLDLPRAQAHLERVASALHVDGILTVFNPSITQITGCVEVIKKKKLPLWLDRVLELGPSMAGGREWSVQAVKPRALIKAQNDRMEALDTASEGSPSLADDNAETTRDQEQAQALANRDEGWEMICRPKVGDRISGGGFLGVWRRMRDRKDGGKPASATSTSETSEAE